ncbi:hypothetical protein F5Y19DRAFT_266986 [Xylariaceae sp. FL1651]|nr:hypothetical protein F5Y19DRAFT_266986 [Xylariaceae sp. FL1651]
MPKVDSKASLATRSAWSRDAKPNTSSVTYSRRSYHYDREFSDSIVTSSEGFQDFPLYRPAELTIPRSRARDYDLFTRGRVFQSASHGDDGDDRTCHAELPSRPIEELAGSQLQTQMQTTTSDPEPRPSFAGLDIQHIAQGIIVVTDFLVRMSEIYELARERQADLDAGDNEDEDEDYLDPSPDPYHLEAGRPRRLRMLPRTPRRSPQIATPTRSRTGTTPNIGGNPPIETQGRRSSASSTTTIKTQPPPLPPSKRTCYYLIAGVGVGVAASFALALWWARSQGDVSAGFTLGSYVVAVIALITAAMGMFHAPSCRCWKTSAGR